MGTSRLHKAVPSGWPVFGLYADGSPVTINDANISEVTIHRGKADRGGGVHPSTLEATFTGQPIRLNGKNIRLYIRDNAAAWIGERTGVAPAEIAVRFEGRLGIEEVLDRGSGRARRVTVAASSWSSQLAQSARRYTIRSGQRMDAVITQLVDASRFSVTSFGKFDRLQGDLVGTYRDEIDKVTTDLGILVRDTRANGLEILSTPYRDAYARGKLGIYPPLTRAQALAPTRWGQQNAATSRVYRVTYTGPDAGGATATHIYQRKAVDLDPRFDVTDVDLTHSTNEVGQIPAEFYARSWSESAEEYAIPSITVDLLSLLRSNNSYNHKVAGRLLALEAGDPVMMAYDWPSQLRGVAFVEGMTEHITANRWELELQLVPWEHVTGNDRPIPQGWTWDSVNPDTTWDDAAGAWDIRTP